MRRLEMAKKPPSKAPVKELKSRILAAIDRELKLSGKMMEEGYSRPDGSGGTYTRA
jgi:hypothetical protein